MKDRLVSFGRELALPAIPADSLPPYGGRRREFALALQHIPEGGLGFHGTTSAFKESIDLNGLDAKLAPDRLKDDTSFCFFDPQQDPLFNLTQGEERTISTYHRLRNTLEELTLDYGIEGHHRLYVPDDVRPVIVVFVNNPTVMTFNGIVHEQSTIGELDGLSFDERVKEDIRRKAYMGSHQISRVGSVLPIGKLESLPRNAILDMYEVLENESIKVFVQRVIDELVVRLATTPGSHPISNPPAE